MAGILPENFGNNGPDLAAYPVIRLDHIPLLSGKLLETALGDVGDLLGVMHSKASNGESVPKLAFYLQKQMDAMRLEASKRFAQSEVSSRLQQVESILSAAPAPAHVPQLQLKSDVPMSRSGPSVAGSISSRTSALRDDLDSTLAEKPATTSRSQNQIHYLSVPEPTPGPDPVVFKSHSSESSRRPLMEGVEFVPAPSAKASTAEPAMRPRPAPTVEPFVVGDAVFSMVPVATSSGFASSSSVASAGSKKRAKNKRTSESISYRAWKPIDSLNVNFATEFVVAAPDEHRVSRYALPPKKKEPQPDPEEQREREKQARREAAARRLAERRAAQKQQKRQRRPTPSVTSEPAAVNAKTGHDSGEDSVSEEEPDDGFGDASASAETGPAAPAAAPTVTVKQPSLQPQPQLQSQIKRVTTEGIDKNGSKGRGSDRGKSKGKAAEGSKSDGAQLAQLHDQLDAANKSVRKLQSELAAAVKAQPQQQRQRQQQQQQQQQHQQQSTKEQQFVDAQRRAEAVARVARAVAGAGASTGAKSDAHAEKTQSGNGNAKGAVARAPSRAATGAKTSAPKSTEASSPITAATAAPSSPRDQLQTEPSPGLSSPSPLPLPLPAHALLPPELRPLQDQNQGHGQAEQDSPASRQRRHDFQAKSGAALETVRRLKLQRQGSQGNVLVAADSEVGGSRDAAPTSASPRKLSPRPNYQEIESNGPPANAITGVVVSREDLPEDGRQPIPISNNSEAMVTPRRLHSIRDLVRPEGSSVLAQPFASDPADLGSASAGSSPLHATAPLLQLVRGALRSRTEAEWEDAQRLDADGEDLDAVDFYACSRGPDELLGLRVWRLMDVEFDFREEPSSGAGSGAGAARGQWAIDMASYHEPVPEEELLQLELLRMTRSTVRRKVSAGLIALVLGCEELMSGANARLYASQDQDALRAAWQRALLSFDQMASQLSEEHAEKLFDEVWVCGNGHAVCRKLEGLVKSQVFAFENSLTCFSDAAQLLAVASPSQRSGSWEVSRLEGFAYGEEGGEFDDDEVEVEGGEGGRGEGGRGEGAFDEGWGDDTWIEEREGQEEDLAVDQRQQLQQQQLQQLQQLQRIVYDGLSMAELGVEPVDEDDEDEDDDEDDGSILPLYAQLLAPVANVSNALSPQAQPRPQPEKELDRQRQSLQPRQNKKTQEPRSARGGQGQALVAATSVSNLKAVFPFFGAIFPATYGANGLSMPAAGASLVLTPHMHRAVAGSLEAQSKMYCEWLEVMSDYSTALSQPLTTAKTGDLSGAHNKYYRVNSSRSEVYSIVTDALTTQPCLTDWEELPAGLGLGATWNLLWTWSKPRLSLPTMLVWQRVNHFHDSKQLTRKDLLKKNLQRYTGMGGRAAAAFEIMPQTFLLPQEYIHFVQAFQEIEARRLEAGVQNYWIMKPVGMSRGRGISLVRDVASLAYSQTSVIQRYVERPLCLDGYKFDLRLYVLVTSFRPLEAFIYTEGFARVSTARYSLDGADMANRFIHLTNSSIQKQNTAGPSKDNPLRNPAGGDGAEAAGRGGSGGGSKLTLQGPNGLWARLRLVGIDPDQLWSDIQLCVLKSLVVVDEKMTFQPCSFELFGYDVLIDSDLRPWLLEVNASPSLARENAVDHEIKNALIRDTITLVDPPAYDRAQAAKIFRRRSGELAKGGGGGGGGGRQNDPDLQADLQAILLERPRAYGEDPRTPGLYERLCPNTRVYEKAVKLKSKIFKA